MTLAIGDRVRVVNGWGPNQNATGVIQTIEEESDGYYDDDDNYIIEEVFNVYRVNYDSPIGGNDGYSPVEYDIFAEDDIVFIGKAIREPSGFSKFIKRIEE